MEKGYNCPLWLTYKQAAELGGQVRKGEKGSLVVYANTFTKTGTDEQGAEVETEIPFMKGYTVFNAEQIDGLPAHFYATVAPLNNAIERLESAERFFANTKATIQHGGNRAFYSPDRDIVQMPELQTFRDAESYYATLAHEMTHWTRHPSRLDRDLGRKRFGDAGYAMEELVAEIGAAFLCADLGITPETRDDHAAYIASWLQSPQERQARDLHRRQPCAEGRRLSQRVATEGRDKPTTCGRPRRLNEEAAPKGAAIRAAAETALGRGCSLRLPLARATRLLFFSTKGICTSPVPPFLLLHKDFRDVGGAGIRDPDGGRAAVIGDAVRVGFRPNRCRSRPRCSD